MTEYKKGLLAALACYILWGVLPLYWKLLEAPAPTKSWRTALSGLSSSWPSSWRRWAWDPFFGTQ